jgi:hypothetical protein
VPCQAGTLALNANDPVVVAAFRSALIRQGVIAVVIFSLLGAVWAGARGVAAGPADDLAPDRVVCRKAIRMEEGRSRDQSGLHPGGAQPCSSQAAQARWSWSRLQISVT